MQSAVAAVGFDSARQTSSPASLGSAAVHCRPEADVNDRLDEAKIEQLRGWGSGLSADGGYELRAAGKAILLLIEEIDRLHIDVWNAKAAREQDRPDRVGADDQLEASMDRTLRSTLSRIRGRTSNRQMAD
jgi:hypothetical protein